MTHPDTDAGFVAGKGTGRHRSNAFRTLSARALRDSIARRHHRAVIFSGHLAHLFSRKGSRYHRSLGFIYLGLMTITSFTAMFVQSIRPGHYSWFHIFIPITLWGVFSAIWRIRKGDIRGHRQAMLGTYFGGLIAAGALSFAPGRLMYALFFGRPT